MVGFEDGPCGASCQPQSGGLLIDSQVAGLNECNPDLANFSCLTSFQS